VLKFHPQHCWARPAGDQVEIGLSAHAREKLGEILYIDLPSEGAEILQGEELGELESTKTMAPLICPLSGTVVEVNTELEDNIQWLNESPQDRGWMCRMRPSRPPEMASLLSEKAYLQQAED
jgi:glycine cleavage system H protein